MVESFARAEYKFANPQDAGSSLPLADEARGELSRPAKPGLRALHDQLASLLAELTLASREVGTLGFPQASADYMKSIQLADSIDQSEVARQRKIIFKELISHPDMKPEQRKFLLQLDMDLHTLQRAPGFSRANMGLAMIRAGYANDGEQLLAQAQSIDPEMKEDPNFRRHHAAAVAKSEQAARRDASPETPPIRPSATDLSQQPALNPGQTPSDRPATNQTPSQVPGLTRPQESQPGQKVQPETSQIENRADTTRISPFVPSNREQPSPLQQSMGLFRMVTSPQSLTPELRKQFEAAIAAADQGQSPRVASLAQEINKTQAAINSQMTDQVLKQVGALDQQALAIVQKLPKEKQDQIISMYQQIDKAPSRREREIIEGRISALSPDLMPILGKRDQALGPQILERLYDLNQKNNDLSDERNQSALTRFTYGQALAKAGDLSNAQKYMADALARNNNPELAAAMKQAADQLTKPGDPTVQPPPSTDSTPQSTTQTQQQSIPAIDLLKSTDQKFQAAPDKAQAIMTLYPDYQRAISLANAGCDQVAAQMKTLQDQVNKVWTPDKESQYQKLASQQQQELAKLSPAEKDQFNKLFASGTTDAERAQIQQSLTQTHPQLISTAQQMVQLTKEAMPLIAQANQLQPILVQAYDAKFLTNLLYANALDQAGDSKGSKQQLTNAFGGVPPESRAAYAADPNVAALMKKEGLVLNGTTVTAVEASTLAPSAVSPAPTDAKPPSAVSATPTDSAAKPPSAVSPPPTDSAVAPPTDVKPPAVSPTAEVKTPLARTSSTEVTQNQIGNPRTDAPFSRTSGTQSPDDLAAKSSYSDLMQLAAMKLPTSLDVARPYFEAAIKSADKDAGDDKVIKTITYLQQALETGKYVENGQEKAVTNQERLQAHQVILDYLKKTVEPMDSRIQYSTALKSNHLYADAEKQMLAAKDAADRIPISLIRKEVELLQKDAKDPAVAPLASAQMTDLATKLQQNTQLPIQIRYAIASFYISGGRMNDGTPIKDLQITGYDASGKPVQEAVDTHILKPEQAAGIIQEVVQKQKDINGVDLTKSPELDQTLAGLRVLTMANSPDELKKRIAAANHYFDDGCSTFWSTAAGLATTAVVMAAMSRFMPGSSQYLRYGVAGLAGFGTSTVTNHEIQTKWFKHDDFTWSDAAFQGGGTYVATSALLLSLKGLTNHFGANFNPARTGELGMAALESKGASYYKPLLEAIQNANGVPSDELLNAAASNTGTYQQLANFYTQHGLQIPDQISKLITAGSGSHSFGATLQGLADTYRAAGYQVPTQLATALQGGDKLLDATTAGQFLSQNGVAYNNLYTLFPQARGMEVPLTSATQSTTPPSGFFSRAMNKANELNPWRPLSADAIPADLGGTQFKIGYTSYFGYDVLNTSFAGTRDWLNNQKDANGNRVTPLGVLQERLVPIALESLVAAPVIGGSMMSAGTPLNRNPFAAYSEASNSRAAWYAQNAPKNLFETFAVPYNATLYEGSMITSSALAPLARPMQILSFGGTTVPAFAPRGLDIYMGSQLSQTGAPYQKLLDLTTKPIENEDSASKPSPSNPG
jgi:hypothetical protein